MNNAGLIVLALLGGALMVLLILGMAFLGWALWTALRRIDADAKAREQEILALKVSVETAKSSYAGVKADMVRQQESFLKETRTMIAGYAEQMQESVGRINAQALETASIRGLQACIRMEKVAVAMQKLLMTVDVPEENTLAPEEYGPDDGTIYAAQSSVARADAEIEQEEFAETLFTR